MTAQEKKKTFSKLSIVQNVQLPLDIVTLNLG